MVRRQLYLIRFHRVEGAWFVESAVGRVGGPFSRVEEALDDANARAAHHEVVQIDVYDREGRLVEERVVDLTEPGPGASGDRPGRRLPARTRRRSLTPVGHPFRNG